MEADGVFEGGGVKGIGLIGALKRTEEQGVELKRVAGTSAGAIVASLYSAGYSSDELKALLYSTDFRKFLDMSDMGCLKYPIGFFRILFRYGIHSGRPFHTWIRERLAQKGVSKFKDLKLPLKLVASDITNKQLLTFDSEKHAELEVAEAVRMSMSIPLFFYVYKWRLAKNHTLVVDGGLLNNYPINIFDDHERQTLGFKLISPEETQPPEKISNIFSYIKSVLDTMMVAHEKIHVEETDWARTIPIPTGEIKTTQFDLNREQKDWLYNSGYEAAEKFFVGHE